jgi:acyl dehydratase
MPEGSQLTYDESVIGQEVEVGQFEVTEEQVAAFCEATGETNPLYTNEGTDGRRLAPPGIVHAPTLERGPDANVKFGNTMFHAGERLEIMGPIYVGDHLTARTSVKEVYEKTGRTGSMVFEVRRTVYSNQAGLPVVATESSFVRREV